MIDLVVILGASVAVLASRTSRAVAGYVVVAGAATYATMRNVPHTTQYLIPFAISIMLKIVIAPVAVARLIRTRPAADDLRPSLSMPWRIIVLIGLLWLAAATAALPALRDVALAGAATFTLLCGATTLMFNRNVLAGVAGLFLLDAGASVAGASFAVQLPEALEMGAAFDALVLTVVAVMLARAIARHDASLDVRSLRRLRG